jgi:replicative DNA helicase
VQSTQPLGTAQPEAEEAVLGAVLINPEAYYDVASFLRADDFYIHRHRWIWETFTRLHERRIPIDLLTVTDELDQQGQLEETGGPAYLTALINNVPTRAALGCGRIIVQCISPPHVPAANGSPRHQQDASWILYG